MKIQTIDNLSELMFCNENDQYCFKFILCHLEDCRQSIIQAYIIIVQLYNVPIQFLTFNPILIIKGALQSNLITFIMLKNQLKLCIQLHNITQLPRCL